MNPCGSVVDVIRTCYSTDMRFFSDDPTKITRVDWYKTTGPNMPFASSFGSKTYDRIEGLVPLPIGEVEGTQKWRGWNPPYPIDPGPPCGTSQQWAQGATAADPIPAQQPGSLLPVCCPPAPEGGLVGVGIGESSFVTPCCAEPVPGIVFLSMGAPSFSTCADLNNAVIPLLIDIQVQFPFPQHNVYTSPPIKVGGIDVVWRLGCVVPTPANYFLQLFLASDLVTQLQGGFTHPGPGACAAPFAQSVDPMTFTIPGSSCPAVGYSTMSISE